MAKSSKEKTKARNAAIKAFLKGRYIHVSKTYESGPDQTAPGGYRIVPGKGITYRHPKIGDSEYTNNVSLPTEPPVKGLSLTEQSVSRWARKKHKQEAVRLHNTFASAFEW